MIKLISNHIRWNLQGIMQNLGNTIVLALNTFNSTSFPVVEEMFILHTVSFGLSFKESFLTSIAKGKQKDVNRILSFCSPFANLCNPFTIRLLSFLIQSFCHIILDFNFWVQLCELQTASHILYNHSIQQNNSIVV